MTTDVFTALRAHRSELDRKRQEAEAEKKAAEAAEAQREIAFAGKVQEWLAATEGVTVPIELVQVSEQADGYRLVIMAPDRSGWVKFNGLLGLDAREDGGEDGGVKVRRYEGHKEWPWRGTNQGAYIDGGFMGALHYAFPYEPEPEPTAEIDAAMAEFLNPVPPIIEPGESELYQAEHEEQAMDALDFSLRRVGLAADVVLGWLSVMDQMEWPAAAKESIMTLDAALAMADDVLPWRVEDENHGEPPAALAPEVPFVARQCGKCDGRNFEKEAVLLRCSTCGEKLLEVA